MGIEYKNIIDRSGTYAQLTTIDQLLPGQAGFCTDRLTILYRRRLDAPTRPGEIDELEAGMGSAWYDGTSVPSSVLGVVGDYFLLTTNGDVYRKDGALGWTVQGNIRGPQGIPGNNGADGDPGPQGDSTQWLNGVGVPSGSTGDDGDYYLDNITGDVYAKTEGVWVIVANIMGPVGADDKTVKTTTNDGTPGFLSGKILSGDSSIEVAVVGAAGADQKLDIRTSSQASGAPNGQQLWDFATSNDSGPLVNAQATWAFLCVSERTMLISKMRVWISQIGGSLVKLGLYDASGNLLSASDDFAPSLGVTTVNLVTPVALTGGQLFYMAIWWNDSTGNLRFLRLSERNVDSTTPLMQRFSVGTNPTDKFPSSISTSGGVPIQYRPWLMVSE